MKSCFKSFDMAKKSRASWFAIHKINNHFLGLVVVAIA